MVQALDNFFYGVLENLAGGTRVLRLILVGEAYGSGGLHHGTRSMNSK